MFMVFPVDELDKFVTSTQLIGMHEIDNVINDFVAKHDPVSDPHIV